MPWLIAIAIALAFWKRKEIGTEVDKLLGKGQGPAPTPHPLPPAPAPAPAPPTPSPAPAPNPWRPPGPAPASDGYVSAEVVTKVPGTTYYISAPITAADPNNMTNSPLALGGFVPYGTWVPGPVSGSMPLPQDAPSGWAAEWIGQNRALFVGTFIPGSSGPARLDGYTFYVQPGLVYHPSGA
jgi:hypothetical protein